MEINGRVGRQILANFKVIFDLLVFLFLFYSATKIKTLLCNSYDYFCNSEQKSTLVLLQLKIQSTRKF